ncbi:hypothetical protein BJ508DRAFT_118820 [Ascobolus immersus RN42]|uniref:Uncharacterized protein n=1 Tax=Ascobolus immersus RN42 TaxID=1160509 RepID=A0A3N4IA44_ASCIM|nr:hypothetical protein BJ508DRAFT_118820 [Ascobolus immersus RN42]
MSTSSTRENDADTTSTTGVHSERSDPLSTSAAGVDCSLAADDQSEDSSTEEDSDATEAPEYATMIIEHVLTGNPFDPHRIGHSLLSATKQYLDEYIRPSEDWWTVITPGMTSFAPGWFDPAKSFCLSPFMDISVRSAFGIFDYAYNGEFPEDIREVVEECLEFLFTRVFCSFRLLFIKSLTSGDLSDQISLRNFVVLFRGLILYLALPYTVDVNPETRVPTKVARSARDISLRCLILKDVISDLKTTTDNLENSGVWKSWDFYHHHMVVKFWFEDILGYHINEQGTMSRGLSEDGWEITDQGKIIGNVVRAVVKEGGFSPVATLDQMAYATTHFLFRFIAKLLIAGDWLRDVKHLRTKFRWEKPNNSDASGSPGSSKPRHTNELHFTGPSPIPNDIVAQLTSKIGDGRDVKDVPKRLVMECPLLRDYMRILVDLHSDMTFRQRCEAKLVREDGQVWLIQTTLLSMQAELATLMISDSEATPDSLLIVVRRYSELVAFFRKARFRSERLEVLIRRYVEEDGSPSFSIVNGVRSATEPYDKKPGHRKFALEPYRKDGTGGYESD